MTTPEKCEAILKAMHATANRGERVTIADDGFGGNTATVYVGKAHTHVGIPDGTWEQLVDDLHNSFTGGPGLSWA